MRRHLFLVTYSQVHRPNEGLEKIKVILNVVRMMGTDFLFFIFVFKVNESCRKDRLEILDLNENQNSFFVPPFSLI